MNEGPSGGGLSDWAPRQREVVVRDARIDWTDEKLAAPELNLTGVTLRLYNEGDQHRFGLRAGCRSGRQAARRAGRSERTHGTRSRALGGHVLRAGGLRRSGCMAQVDSVADRAAAGVWRRADVGGRRGRAGEAGDCRPAASRGPHASRGRSARTRPGRARRAHFVAIVVAGLRAFHPPAHAHDPGRNRAAAGRLPAPAAARRRHEARPGELSANALDLEPLATFADHLPLDGSLREELRRFDPRGSVYDLAVKWTGGWPVDTYQARARFEKLGIEAQGLIPGFKNAHGTLSERYQGQAHARQQTCGGEPAAGVHGDSGVRAARGAGHVDPCRWRLRCLANVSFANGDVAGTLQGAYQSVPVAAAHRPDGGPYAGRCASPGT